MDNLQLGIITLIRSGLTGEKIELPSGFDLEAAHLKLREHGIIPLAYVGAVNCGLDKDLPVMRKLFWGYLQGLAHSERQMKAVADLCEAFEAAGIDYMPLKGCNLKRLYPKPELRLMGDADILICAEQYQRIRSVLLKRGFEEKVESDHELVWSGRSLLLELHKRLIPSYNKDYEPYFGDGWRLATEKAGHRYSMRAEDEYIYLLTHFAKHYRDGGIGCRHAADLWIWRTAHPHMDEAYIACALERLRLLEFEQNIVRMLNCWFGGEIPDEKTQFITQVMFQSGAWGSVQAHAAAAGARSAAEAGSVRKGIALRMRQLLFPGATVMGKRYPVLKKYPALTPLFWPIRWVTAALFRRANIRRCYRYMSSIDSECIENYRESLRYVGLDFRIKE